LQWDSQQRKFKKRKENGLLTPPRLMGNNYFFTEIIEIADIFPLRLCINTPECSRPAKGGQ